ncbi:hypothetical protein [Dyadobacter sp.]|uniref:hypothetical protein n=1 Tax=Dyadobacter sp. TaxID=1914288 RepID=UPI003F71DB53
MQQLLNIFPPRATILKWLFLVILSTGNLLFQDVSTDNLYRTEQVFTTKKTRSNSGGTVLFSFRGVTPFQNGTFQAFCLSRLLHFASSTNTRLRVLTSVFHSFSYRMLLKAAPQPGRISPESDPAFSRS